MYSEPFVACINRLSTHSVKAYLYLTIPKYLTEQQRYMYLTKEYYSTPLILLSMTILNSRAAYDNYSILCPEVLVH